MGQIVHLAKPTPDNVDPEPSPVMRLIAERQSTSLQVLWGITLHAQQISSPTGVTL
jgi:hypothetical protein